MLNVIVFFVFIIATNEGHSKLLISESEEKCLKCICEASSACTDLLQCAEKTIDEEYWKTAGELIAGGENNRSENTTENYNNCKKDRTCILTTMHFYISFTLRKLNNDIDCNGFTTCADQFAVHNFGMRANQRTSVFSLGLSKRFDRCMNHGIFNVTNKWSPNDCSTIASTTSTVL
ncbi:hypothetical protein HHI36_014172 [Cryptolaemus montrouzieri]|uniref:lysozyme n=1 Tax=Cryptolaemus montrouzieri TaxID=559131 RepID=A0ABD2N229_9CUCU